MVTIAIPFFNDERYLELAIKSVLKQTYTAWRLILMNDGSKDNSFNIARKYEALDPRIKVYSDGENKQLATRLNEIAHLAETKYLARMDADDIMHPKRIESQVKILEENPQIDVLGTNAYSIDGNNQIQGVRIKYDNNNLTLIDVKGFIHPTIMAKTEWFRANPYDTKAVRVEDFELWQRTYAINVFKLYTEPLLFYREFGANYYKKYFKGVKPLLYVANKNGNIMYYLILMRFVIKGISYKFLNMIKLEDLLIKRRSLPLSDDLKNKGEDLLFMILN